jgi:hypothetical protein
MDTWVAILLAGTLIWFLVRWRARVRAEQAWAEIDASEAKASRRSLRIVVLSLGTRGDVEPLAALGAAAVARGHHVTFCTTDNFRSLVESVPGLHFRSCGLARIPQPPSLYRARSMVEFLTAVAGTISRLYAPLGSALFAAAGGEGEGEGAPPDVILANLFAQHFGLDIGEALDVPVWLVKLAPDRCVFFIYRYILRESCSQFDSLP